MEIREWNQIFRGLANVNRLKIIILLSRREKMHVTDIAGALDISFVATSRHLGLLHDLGLLESEGKEGHVYYRLNERMAAEARGALRLFVPTK